MNIRAWIAENILSLPKREKAPPIAQALSEPGWLNQNASMDWARPAYGDYYATSVPVYAAINVRADAVCRPPLRVYRDTKNGERKELADHPVALLLAKVNDFWTRSDLWRATVTYLDLWGSAFWVLTKAGPSSSPTELWPARPDRMRVIASRERYVKGFEYQEQGARVPLRPDEVIWMRRFNPMAELAGLSPMAPLRLSADMGREALRYNRAAFKNGVLFGSVGFKAEGVVTDQQVEDFWKRLSKKYSGPDNAQRPLVYTAMEPKNLGFSAREMEYLGTMKWALEDVARVYGVPKAMLHHPDDPTYSNAKAQEQWFWRNTVVPLLLFLQERINEMLLPLWIEPGLFAEFDLSEIEALQADANEVANRQRADIQTGILTVYEVRAERNLAPVPWGDTWWVPLTLMPADSVGMPTEALEPGKAAPFPPLKTSDFQPDGWKRLRPPMFTDIMADRVADAHAKRLGRIENRFLDTQRQLFARQERDVLRRLRAAGQKGLLTKQGTGETLFEPGDWLDSWVSTGSPVFLASLTDSATAQIAQFGLGISFDINRPMVREWLEARTKFWASRVNEDTAKLLISELDEAAKLGEPIKAIQGRVEKVFRFSDTVRSERIARTEMNAAATEGALDAYRQSGVVDSKIWLATVDDRTRGHHLEAHRQVVPLEAPFLVGGEEIMGPGQGSPGNAINCRCGVAPVLGERRRALPQQAMDMKEIK